MNRVITVKIKIIKLSALNLNLIFFADTMSFNISTRIKRIIHHLQLFIGLVLVCSHHCYGQATSDRPNIILFLSDDLGYGDLACYGNPIIKTPNLDRFASEGVRLTDCHSAGTVCSPSRASILTGRNPYRSGFYDILGNWNAYLKHEELTIPELIRGAGYASCFVGKWHLSYLDNKKKNQPTPGDQGFDHWFATSLNAFEGPQNPKKFLRNGQPMGEMNGYFCDVIVEEACSWMSQKRIEPFFLMVATHEPHTPINPPAEFARQYNNRRVDSIEKSITYGGVGRPEGIGKYKSEYYGSVAQMDNAFGRLMKYLDSSGLRENTIVIFTSDNGPETPVTIEESKGEWTDPIRDKCFGTPGNFRGMKRYTFEGGHRVPGIVRWPSKIKAGTTSNRLVNGTDFLPTICAIAKVEPPTDRIIDGQNALDAFLNKKPRKNRATIWPFQVNADYVLTMPNLSMRYNNYSLVAWFPKKADAVKIIDWMYQSMPERFELYDIIKDPGQQSDISKKNTRLLKKLIPIVNREWLSIREEGKKVDQAHHTLNN